MAVIRSVLNSLGYTVQERIFNGVDFGALENRNRLVIVAISNGIDNFNIDSIDKGQRYTKPDSINDVLENVPLESTRWKSFSYLAEKEKRDRAALKGFKRQLLTGDEANLGVIGAGYAKMRSTEPYIIHPTNSGLSRILTKNEHARVKNIPEQVIYGLSETVAHEILGQSVVFSVFEALSIGLSKDLLVWQSNKSLSTQGKVIPTQKCA